MTEETRCACDGFEQGIHRRQCRYMTTQAVFVDPDIKPLPICERCWSTCWMLLLWASRNEAKATP
jgi:hypothetical protein